MSTAWPILKTASELVEEGIVPGGERTLLDLAKRHQVGRKWGRTYVFTPEDIRTLLASLPCPSSSQDELDHPTTTSAALSEDAALRKARALATKKRPTRSGSNAKRKSFSDRSTVTPFPGRSLKPL